MTKLNTEGMATKTLLALYNDYASELGEPAVARFADRAAAERRTIQMHDQVMVHRLSEREAERMREVRTGSAGPVPITPGFEGGYFNRPAVANNEDRFGGVTELKEGPGGNVQAGGGRSDPTLKATNHALMYNQEGLDRVQQRASEVLSQGKPPRWARPKHEAPGAKAYRPKPGSIQYTMYLMLVHPEGVAIADFCAAVERSGSKDKMFFTPPGVWSGLRYLFCALRGYGLSFDGVRLRLLVPVTEVVDAKGEK